VVEVDLLGYFMRFTISISMMFFPVEQVVECAFQFQELS
jgi:hypothetical protein